MKKTLLAGIAALFLATLTTATIGFAIHYMRIFPQAFIASPSKGYVTCAIARYCLGHDGRWIDTLRTN